MMSFHNVLKMSPSVLEAHLNTTRKFSMTRNTPLRRYGLLQLINDFGIIPIDIVFEVAP